MSLTVKLTNHPPFVKKFEVLFISSKLKTADVLLRSSSIAVTNPWDVSAALNASQEFANIKDFLSAAIFWFPTMTTASRSRARAIVIKSRAWVSSSLNFLGQFSSRTWLNFVYSNIRFVKQFDQWYIFNGLDCYVLKIKHRTENKTTKKTTISAFQKMPKLVGRFLWLLFSERESSPTKNNTTTTLVCTVLSNLW